MNFKITAQRQNLKLASALPLALTLLLSSCSPVVTPATPKAVQLQTATPDVATTFVTAPTLAASPVPTIEPTKPPVSLAQIKAPSLSNNLVGEPDTRSLFIYVPPSYNQTTKRYPVVYYLPGYGDSMMVSFNLPGGADRLIETGTIKELILVVADGTNRFGGSFYVNSSMTGNFEDFIVKDVVNYVDSHFRTLAQAQSRGITGHSMGGFGALNIAMHHPDVFSAVYSMSPGLFDENGLAQSQMFSSQGAIYSFLNFRQQAEKLTPQQLYGLPLGSGAFTVAYGLAFAPNPNKAPYIDYPYSDADGGLVRDEAVWKKWESGFGGSAEEVKQYKDNFLKLRGLVVDYGTNDSYAWIPKGCEYFAAQLQAAGIPHELLTYDGNHESGIGSRIGEHMLPFFSKILVSE